MTCNQEYYELQSGLGEFTSQHSHKSGPSLAPTPSVNLRSPGHNTYVVIIPFRVATRKVDYPNFGIW